MLPSAEAAYPIKLRAKPKRLIEAVDQGEVQKQKAKLTQLEEMRPEFSKQTIPAKQGKLNDTSQRISSAAEKGRWGGEGVPCDCGGPGWTPRRL